MHEPDGAGEEAAVCDVPEEFLGDDELADFPHLPDEDPDVEEE